MSAKDHIKSRQFFYTRAEDRRKKIHAKQETALFSQTEHHPLYTVMCIHSFTNTLKRARIIRFKLPKDIRRRRRRRTAHTTVVRGSDVPTHNILYKFARYKLVYIIIITLFGRRACVHFFLFCEFALFYYGYLNL